MFAVAALLLFSQALNEGVALYNKRDYAQALPKLRRAVEEEAAGTPAHAQAMLLLGQSYFLTEKYAEAVPWLRKLRAGGSRPEIDYMLGIACVYTGAHAEAVAAFATMYGVPDRSAAAHLITAQMMMRRNFEDQAEKHAARALELQPTLPEAHRLLGQIALFRGRLDDAVRHLEREIALNPASDDAYHRLGDALCRQDKWAAAITALQRSVWLNPNVSGPYILLGKAYLRTDSLANAEGMLRRALEMDRSNKTAAYLLTQTLMRQGRAEEARRITESLK